MKKLFLLIAMNAALYAGAQKNGFVLIGHCKNADTGRAILIYTGASGNRLDDTCLIKGGEFTFKGGITEPTIGYLQVKSNGKGMTAQIFLEPAQMRVDCDINVDRVAQVKGSKSQAEMDALSALKEPITREMEPLNKRYAEINQVYTNARKQQASDRVQDSLKYLAAAIHDEFDPFRERMAQIDYSFFAAHPTSVVTAFYLRFHTAALSLDSIKMFYNRFGDQTRQSGFGKAIADEIRRRSDSAPGSVAKDFAATDINGKPLRLSGFKGKYVLLDFWASWCVPCRKGNPHLKELYTKYKDKGFEVIGISDDDRDHAAWKKAVAQDGLPWRQVLRGLDMDKKMKGLANDTDISEKFGISTLPTQILIDREGKIIGRYGGGGEAHEALDGKLNGLFQ